MPIDPRLPRFAPGVGRRTLLAAAAGLAAVPALGPSARAAAPPSDGVLTVGIPVNLTGLDPADVNDNASLSACRLMFEGLFTFDRTMKLVPLLAASYTANPAATEFTFKLRPNVSFEDGAKFDAAAVKANMDRVSDPNTHIKRKSLFSMIKQTDVIDPLTVKITLKTPFGAFIPTLAHPAAMMLSPQAIKKYAGNLLRNPVGTGPYVFVSWSADTLKTKKNPNYWRAGLPHLNGVTFRSVPEDGARIAMLQTGEAQMIYPVPPQMVPIVSRSADLVLANDPSIFARYVAMNVTQKPFDDLRVRQALNYAVNKEAFTRVVYNGYAQPMQAPEAPRVTFYSKQGEWPYDPTKAKQLLGQAGLSGGFDTTMWSLSDTQSVQAMQFLQQQLGAVGVRVKVEPLEAGVMSSRIWTVQKPADSKLQLYYGGWSPSTGDADWALRPLFATGSFPPALYNVGYYSNKQVDQDLAAGLGTADAAQRAKAYTDAQAVIWKDAPWIFLVVANNLSAHTKSVSGVYQAPDQTLLINEGQFTSG